MQLVDRTGKPLGGGCHEDEEHALRVAVAEAIERALVKRLARDPVERQRFKLDAFPTSCGFAFGFERDKTAFRAIAEAAERHLWSSWIDHGIPLNGVSGFTLPSGSLGSRLLADFEKLRAFEGCLVVASPLGKLRFRFGVLLAFRSGGIFPGSRVCLESEDPWAHAAVEAWRHWLILNSVGTSERADSLPFPRNGIVFFGRDAAAAIAQIPRHGTGHTEIPTMQLTLLENAGFPEFGGHLFRAICDGLIGWHLGNEARFVY